MGYMGCDGPSMADLGDGLGRSRRIQNAKSANKRGEEDYLQAMAALASAAAITGRECGRSSGLGEVNVCTLVLKTENAGRSGCLSRESGRQANNWEPIVGQWKMTAGLHALLLAGAKDDVGLVVVVSFYCVEEPRLLRPDRTFAVAKVWENPPLPVSAASPARGPLQTARRVPTAAHQPEHV